MLGCKGVQNERNAYVNASMNVYMKLCFIRGTCAI